VNKVIKNPKGATTKARTWRKDEHQSVVCNQEKWADRVSEKPGIRSDNN